MSLWLIYFMHGSLYILILYPILSLPIFPLLSGNHQFVLYICESVSVLLYSFISSNIKKGEKSDHRLHNQNHYTVSFSLYICLFHMMYV